MAQIYSWFPFGHEMLYYWDTSKLSVDNLIAANGKWNVE